MRGFCYCMVSVLEDAMRTSEAFCAAIGTCEVIAISYTVSYTGRRA